MSRNIAFYKDVYLDQVDECERMIGCLQYCSFLPIVVNQNSTSDSNPFRCSTPEKLDIQPFFEKGSIYRGMISNLQEFSLLDQCFYIIQKFTEFRERIEMMDVEIKIKDIEIKQLLLKVLTRIKMLFQFQSERCGLMQLFYIVKIERLLLLVHSVDLNCGEAALLLISQDVSYWPISFEDPLYLLDSLSEAVNRLLHVNCDQPKLFQASLVCLIRDFRSITCHDEQSELEHFDRKQTYDEQYIDFYEFLQESTQLEIEGSDWRSSNNTIQPTSNDNHKMLSAVQVAESCAAIINDDGDTKPTPSMAGKRESDKSLVNLELEPTESQKVGMIEEEEEKFTHNRQEISPPLKSTVEVERVESGAAILDSSTKRDQSPSRTEVTPDPISDPLFETQTVISGHEDTKKRPDEALSSSLYSDLITSQENEDVTGYVQRAYSALRNRFIDEAMLDYFQENPTELSMSLTASTAFVPPPPSQSHPLQSREEHPNGATETTLRLPPPPSPSVPPSIDDSENQNSDSPGKEHLLVKDGQPASSPLKRNRRLPEFEIIEIGRPQKLDHEATDDTSAKEENESIDKEGEAAFRELAEKYGEVEDSEETRPNPEDSSLKEGESLEKRDEPEVVDPIRLAELQRQIEELRLKEASLRLEISSASVPRTACVDPPCCEGTNREGKEESCKNSPSLEEADRITDAKVLPRCDPEESSDPKVLDAVEPSKEEEALTVHPERENTSEQLEKASPVVDQGRVSTQSPLNIITETLRINPEVRSTTIPIPSTTASVSTSASVSSSQSKGKKVKHAILVEQLSQLQSSIQYHHMQQRILRNQRRVTIGKKIIHLLKQQRLLPENYEQIISGFSPPPLPIPLEKETLKDLKVDSPRKDKRGEDGADVHDDADVSTSGPLSTSPNEVLKKRNLVSSNILEDPFDPPVPDRPSLLSNDRENKVKVEPRDINDLAVVQRILTSENMKPEESAASDNFQKPVNGGIVWNIETPAIDRPKSRVRSFVIPKRASPVIEEAVTVSSPIKPHPEGSNNRLLPRPRSTNNMPQTSTSPRSPSVRSKESEPTKNAIEIESAVKPAQGRSQSAQRAIRPVSRSHHQRNSSNPPLPATKILSNYTQTKNAINYVCLAGAHQEEKRKEVLDLLDFYHSNKDFPAPVPPDLILYEDFKGKINHFLLLFYKAKSLAFKSVYLYDSLEKRLIKVFGKGGPAILADSDPLIKEFLKFETSSKSFKPIPVKAISSTIDAIILEPPKAKNLPL